MEQAFIKAKPIVTTLEQNGYEAYFVGGAVRDSIMGRHIHDVDIATSAPPTVVKTLFPVVIPVGIEHGTVIVRHQNESYEVTTFRREGEYKDHRRPSSVNFIAHLEEDLKRRDFTMNAMALTSEGELIDPFLGKKDIERRIVRTVGSANDRFREDPLRILRAYRFVSQLDFSLADETGRAAHTLREEIRHLSVERITQEFEKLTFGQAVKKALRLLVNNGIHNHLPCLNDQDDTLYKLANMSLSSLSQRREMWALLLYFMKIEPKRFMNAWKLSNNTQNEVLVILSALRENHSPFDRYTLFRLGRSLSESYFRVYNLIRNETVSADLSALRKQYEQLPIKNRSELAVNGADFLAMFDKKPGPWLGRLLHDLEYAVVNGHIENEKSTLKEWGRQWLNH